ncbi:acylphosphatase [Maridesulfovibrio ferrireducens]|uniref:acylphosphatase n=1 Tax=Maridesulfovibrio ferrireducens TaxID=246191 RepID=A0A1G9B0F8_9BACT|nr:acylphosphatase [Maridesulfovibrio ferrireducens]SDK33012.1 acylphosphatase [Maridesulfovibrio ferrireducens]
MIRSYHCVVTGKVQGVFFRSWVNDQAVALHLGGWTRNLDDGPIEVLLQGREADIAEMRTRLLVGPPLSQVTDLKCNWIDYDKKHDSFEIR